MNLDLNENDLTIMGIKFDNIKDFKSVWYALSTNIIEGWTPTSNDVIELKNKLISISKKHININIKMYTYSKLT